MGRTCRILAPEAPVICGSNLVANSLTHALTHFLSAPIDWRILDERKTFAESFLFTAETATECSLKLFRPLLWSLLSPSLPVRTSAYADVITKFSRINNFPFYIAMKTSPRALRAETWLFARNIHL